MRLIDRLPEKQGRAIYLKYYLGLKYKEVAEITGVSKDTAFGRVRYGMQKIRRMLYGRGDRESARRKVQF